jgi:cyclopropane-fatty-acyl-phospholipid synthase
MNTRPVVDSGLFLSYVVNNHPCCKTASLQLFTHAEEDEMKQTLLRLLTALHETAPHRAFSVCLWDGEIHRFGKGEPEFTLTVHNPNAVKSILAQGTLGFGEAYMSGTIDVSGDFKALMRIGSSARFQNLRLSLRTRLHAALRAFTSKNTLSQATKNIAHHYSLGNDFYRLYLDDSMTYSCAYFRSEADTLEQAQCQKYHHICRKLELQKDESLLDVGCGWGGMVLFAAREYGARSTGCTLSVPQAEFARTRIEQEGQSGRAQILLQDYRHVTGSFDKWVSIGMFEHTGKKFIPLFMRKIRTLLAPAGIGLLHTIGKERPTPGDPWSGKYIFPGSYIPTLSETLDAMGRADLVPIDVENLRLHYARTLDEWAARFERNIETAREMFGEPVIRLWRMFLRGCAEGFRIGDLRLYQITFTNGVNNEMPLTRDHLYT